MKVKAIAHDITFRWFRNVFSFMLVFLVLVECIFIFSVTSTMYDSVTSYLERRNEINIKNFKSIIATGQYRIYEVSSEFMSGMTGIENIYVEIFDTEGHLIISSDGCTAADLDRKFLKGKEDSVVINKSVNGQRLMTMTSELKDDVGFDYGTIRYSVSLDKVNRKTAMYIVFSVLAIILVAALVFVSGQYFIQSIVKPVNGIIESAEMIAKGNFNIRLNKKYDDEIGKLSDAINNMAQELSKIDQLKNDFISSISHELRTPLTAIRGWNETISMCDPETDTDMINKGLSIIDSETKRLSTMVEELLDYSKIQSGRFAITKSRINLYNLACSVRDMYTQRSEQTGIDLILSDQPFDMMISGDSNRLKQVYINIIDNAFKHSTEGNSIEIYFTESEGYITTNIKDHGRGIKKEELPYIKEKFFKGSSTKPGSGLGLAICNEIVGLHGGTLDIDSIEFEGTTVSITLPRDQKTEGKET